MGWLSQLSWEWCSARPWDWLHRTARLGERWSCFHRVLPILLLSPFSSIILVRNYTRWWKVTVHGNLAIRICCTCISNIWSLIFLKHLIIWIQLAEIHLPSPRFSLSLVTHLRGISAQACCGRVMWLYRSYLGATYRRNQQRLSLGGQDDSRMIIYKLQDCFQKHPDEVVSSQTLW